MIPGCHAPDLAWLLGSLPQHWERMGAWCRAAAVWVQRCVSGGQQQCGCAPWRGRRSAQRGRQAEPRQARHQCDRCCASGSSPGAIPTLLVQGAGAQLRPHARSRHWVPAPDAAELRRRAGLSALLGRFWRPATVCGCPVRASTSKAHLRLNDSACALHCTRPPPPHAYAGRCTVECSHSWMHQSVELSSQSNHGTAPSTCSLRQATGMETRLWRRHAGG